MASAGERVAVLMVRAWIEPDADPPVLRARITATHDIAAGGVAPSASMASDIDVVCARVRTWLEDFVALQSDCEDDRFAEPADPEP